MNDDEGDELAGKTGTASASGPVAGPRPRPHPDGGLEGPLAGPEVFDHEKLDVYRVAREFLAVAHDLCQRRRISGELLKQFNAATNSILENIGEGAGKTAKADKRHSYELARGSTTEAATQLDIMLIRKLITRDEYLFARKPLLRVAAMLSRMCSAPRTT